VTKIYGRRGPIAAWFAKPADGSTNLTAPSFPAAPTPLNVRWLVSNSYLERVIR